MLMDADNTKNEAILEMRLRQTEILNKIKKTEKGLKDREQLAEGLHLIDFEQLKVKVKLNID